MAGDTGLFEEMARLVEQGVYHSIPLISYVFVRYSKSHAGWVAAGSGLSSSSAFVCVAALSVLAALHQIVPRLVRLMQPAYLVPLHVSTERVVLV